ncbi:cysteine synthase A [Spongiibacter sp. KMU-158]|uniref:cysteine synthase n=1 Tax=Spongiibacter pelagi TaxID=2760804 RepID=A0A927BYW3_9GAMM|nr:cysteine synthase A [Spongiibacter pelagi]MBD2858118.1 cysteine synthase A [Spongiibacter pelagi]
MSLASFAYPQLPDLIGNTPLMLLRQASKLTGCTILGKAEFLNPGGSVKDRTALGIIRDAEARGLLKPGATIVEGTAGNTGIGLTLIANALGYRSVVVMPQSQSREKIELLDLYGADLRLVQPTTYDDPNHYIHTAERLTEKLNESEPNGAFWARQFDNTANARIHETTTGEEIWQQTEGKIDAFICAVGTGGTLAGVSSALKKHNPNVTIGIADPQGSSLYNYYTSGELKGEGRSLAEGIGISLITENLRQAQVDKAYQISDAEALPFIFDLLRYEGLCLGGSSAVNIAGAVRLAKELGPGHTIVTMLCDYGDRYKSRLYNPIFLKNMGLPSPDWKVN